MSEFLRKLENYVCKKASPLAAFYKDSSLETKLSSSPNIAFVCTGNICRSAYAEQKLRDILEEQNKSKINIFSFGLETKPGKPANLVASAVAKERKTDLSLHKTKPFSKDFDKEGTIFFCMEPWQKRALEKKLENSSKQVFLLGPYTSSPSAVILDPYAKSEDFFCNCFDIIDSSLYYFAEQL